MFFPLLKAFLLPFEGNNVGEYLLALTSLQLRLRPTNFRGSYGVRYMGRSFLQHHYWLVQAVQIQLTVCFEFKSKQSYTVALFWSTFSLLLSSCHYHGSSGSISTAGGRARRKFAGLNCLLGLGFPFHSKLHYIAAKAPVWV